LTNPVPQVYFDLMDKMRGNRRASNGAKERPPMRKIHVNLSDDIHQKLRVTCALEDVTIQDWVAKLIGREVTNVLPVGKKGKRAVRND